MANIDLIVNSVLFLIPVLLAFILVSRKRIEVFLYGAAWASLSTYIAYVAINYTSDIFLLTIYIVSLYLLILLGMKYLINISIEERARVISNIPKNLILRAIREASNELSSEWICEYKLKSILKTREFNLELGLLRIKNKFGIYIKCSPGEELIVKAIISAIGFIILDTYLTLFPSESFLIILGYSTYLPILSLILGIYFLYVILKARNTMFKQLSIALIEIRNKIKAAEKLYETLKIITLAKNIKKKIAEKKIKEAIEIAKTMELAEKIRKNN